MNKNNLISIGSLSKLCETSISAIRHYDQIGLLKPTWIDPETNYRFYHQKDINTLMLIRQFKSIGMSLKEIEFNFKTNNLEVLRKCNTDILKIIDKKIEQLSDMKVVFSNFNNITEGIEKKIGTMEIKEIPERKVVFFRKKRVFSEEENLFHAIDLQNIYLKNKIAIKDPFIHLLYDDFDLNTTSVIDIELAAPVIHPFIKENEYFKTIPKNLYACVYIQGFNTDSMQTIYQLKDLIKKENYTPQLPMIFSYILPVPIIKDPKKRIVEVQIPVNKKF